MGDSVNYQGLAYAVLLAQEQEKNPNLTPEQFKAQLLERVKKGAHEALKQKKGGK